VTAALWLLFIQGLLGAFDILYYHEWRARLPGRGARSRPELELHAARDFLYALFFATLPWIAWRGAWALVLGTLLAAEIAITLADFIIEDRVRLDLQPGRRRRAPPFRRVAKPGIAVYLPADRVDPEQLFRQYL
jgi:hypothetical protein